MTTPRELTAEHKQRLERAYDDLMQLATECKVPSVRAAARTALAHVHAAVNGQAIRYDLYSARFLNNRD
jgi:hypothetical protein